MRRSRPPRPKERKTGNHQYPRGNPPLHGRPPKRQPVGKRDSSQPAAGTTLRRPNKGAPRSGWKKPDQNLETRRTGEKRLQTTETPPKPPHARRNPAKVEKPQHPTHPKAEADDNALQTGQAQPLQKTATPQNEASGQNPRRATSMRTFKRMPGTGRRSVSSAIHRRICGRATAPPPTMRRANRRRRPSSGAL